MIYTIIGIFSLAAILGLVLLTYILREKTTPKGIVFTHGPFAAIGLVLLIIYALGNSPGPTESIILFIIAALGGGVLVYRDIMGKPIPKWLAVVHGLIALAGFILLIIFSANK